MLALILGGLEAAVDAGLIRRALLPPPSAIAPVLWDMLASGAVLPPLLATLQTGLRGLLHRQRHRRRRHGLAMGWFPPVFRLLEPVVELLRHDPQGRAGARR